MVKTTLLGGLTPQRFLRDFWQKKPLLIRQAIPGFKGLLTPQEVLELCGSDEAESRLVFRNAEGWQLRRGPLAPRELRRRGAWTVLVQGLNLLRDDADALMNRFDFVPRARLDDLMVSYATDGGGVGPHFDSYDVFLLQGMGTRRWQISEQTDLTILDDAPLRILKNFKVEQEWLLEPGDMLYLPPSCAHNGIAVGECMTYSIGFRAAPAQELATQFLVHLQDRVELAGRYADPDLQVQRHAGEIGNDMVEKVAGIIERIAWNKRTVADFLGCYLTEPKPHVFFEPPEAPLSLARFARKLERHALRLDRKSQLLFHGTRFFLNGEPESVPAGDRKAFAQLADTRALPAGTALSDNALAQLHTWYCDGFVVF